MSVMSFKMKNFPLLNIAYSAGYSLPAPSSLSLWWNGGSLLASTLGIQLATGIFLSLHYSSEMSSAFSSVVSLTRDVNSGWLMRFFHINGASLFFVLLYTHMARGLYFSSWKKKHTWLSGVTIFILVMATAFLGYVLPWGQMSFWGATVITNLFSAIPMIGSSVVFWLWGSFAVDSPTLTRFFGFHFVIPMVIALFSVIHLFFLHAQGSNNPLGLPLNSDKIPFSPYYIWKDLMGLFVMLLSFVFLSLSNPYLFADPENFIEANPLSTPLHIQPEWYFLFAYAILRSIPNKLGGVVALACSVVILYFVPFMDTKFSSKQFYFFNKCLFFGFLGVFLALTYLGACPVEAPFIFVGLIFSILYFAYFLIETPICTLWENILF